MCTRTRRWWKSPRSFTSIDEAHQCDQNSGPPRKSLAKAWVILPPSWRVSRGDAVADEIVEELRALCEPVAIALQAVARAGVEGGEHVLVLGAGPIEQAIVLASSEFGAHIMVSDLVESRLPIAQDMGAVETVVANTDDLTEGAAQWTGGDGPAVIFDATGVPTVVRQGFDLLAASG